ncbi:MAG TPA: hypothetical protein VFN87_04325, partial [Solirubrobacteraceae bacterium]|nr:hypothetical protein [Solirubrobacteraceae bacterium]
ARSPMEAKARSAGGRFEVRDGWSVALGYTGPPERALAAAAWADASHLGKLQLQGRAEALDAAAGTGLSFGTALRADGAWWCRLTATRALVIGAGPPVGERMRETGGVEVLDVTSNFAALTIAGPQAREVFARFCALDLRPAVTPVGALRPGSIARQPGILIREDHDRYLFLFGWATGEYMWDVVADACGHLGGGPVTLDALGAVPEPEVVNA